jgi:putative colanic acid biosynthesis UDP-glucose lipid carrier transferase
VRAIRPALRTLLLLVVTPLALVLAVPIALANLIVFRRPGRILFSQPRVGLQGRTFRILKFRTMTGDDDEFDSWKSGRDDERVTRFGRFLRNTHLDELPQLVNILRGEMDFVGPRPEMVAIHEWACAHVPYFAERGAVLPGVTGLAQVTIGYTGKDEQAYGRKLDLDLAYIEHVSLRLDLSILARTALWMLRGRGWQPAAVTPALQPATVVPSEPVPGSRTQHT